MWHNFLVNWLPYSEIHHHSKSVYFIKLHDYYVAELNCKILLAHFAAFILTLLIKILSNIFIFISFK